MDIFLSSRVSGSRPGEWSRKHQASCQRKLNFYSSPDIQGLPNVKFSPTGNRKGIRAPCAFRPSPPLETSKPLDNYVSLDPKPENKKTVARRHLIGSLSAPMKTTGVVRTTTIGRSLGSPPRGYPDWKQYMEVDNFHRKPEADNLQGVDKMENIHQRRLDLKLQKPAPYQNVPRGPVTSTSNFNNNPTDSNTLRKPLYWTSDVAKLSDVNELVSETTSEETVTKVADNVNPPVQQRHRVDWSQHRPLTPNLLKKLNNMKISTIVKTQHWVNQLPQDTTWSKRQISTPSTCAETSWGNRRNSSSGKANQPWIYGNGR